MDIKTILSDHALWMNDDKTGKKANLRGAHLTGADLNNANLRGADLTFANLRGADLRGAEIFNGWILKEKTNGN